MECVVVHLKRVFSCVFLSARTSVYGVREQHMVCVCTCARACVCACVCDQLVIDLGGHSIISWIHSKLLKYSTF